MRVKKYGRLDNQQLNSEQEKAQRLSLPRGVRRKLLAVEVDEALAGNAEGQDIVCA